MHFGADKGKDKHKHHADGPEHHGKSDDKRSSEAAHVPPANNPDTHEKDKPYEVKGDIIEIELEQKLIKMEQQYNEMLDSARRIKAEYENFKKRSEINYTERAENEKGQLIREFLPVYDNLQRACLAAGKSQSLEQFEQGVEMIVKQFKVMLDKFDIEAIDAINVEFNPELHEALMMRESDKVKHDKVVEVFEKGYKMKGRVIRHAKVIVEKPVQAPAPSEPAKPEKEETPKENIENKNENSTGGE
jgi:molecular chaperone GrpE